MIITSKVCLKVRRKQVLRIWDACILQQGQKKNDHTAELMDWEIGDEEAKKLVRLVFAPRRNVWQE